MLYMLAVIISMSQNDALSINFMQFNIIDTASRMEHTEPVNALQTHVQEPIKTHAQEAVQTPAVQDRSADSKDQPLYLSIINEPDYLGLVPDQNEQGGPVYANTLVSKASSEPEYINAGSIQKR